MKRYPDCEFQSTLPVGEATAFDPCKRLFAWHFNPRFPWGKRLPIHSYRLFRPVHFNPRFPWGKRHPGASTSSRMSTFQSTLPVGEATARRPQAHQFARYFNPRFPWGKRPARSSAWRMKLLFQSTLPVGEATDHAAPKTLANHISIHASRGGSDVRLDVPGKQWIFISIHASRGGSDRVSSSRSTRRAVFQSTLPVGEATRLPQLP